MKDKVAVKKLVKVVKIVVREKVKVVVKELFKYEFG